MASASEPTNQSSRNDEFETLFANVMKQNWEEVLELQMYKKYTKKLTISKQTALHIAVSFYVPDQENSGKHLSLIEKMVHSAANEFDPKKEYSVADDESDLNDKSSTADQQNDGLKDDSNDESSTADQQNDDLKDAKGNTPLHLAAILGCEDLCQCIAMRCAHWIEKRNDENETPLFLAARHGKKEAFLRLCEIYGKYYMKKEGKEIYGKGETWNALSDKIFSDKITSLCKDEDGRTILHSAIAGEYFDLAFQIIHDYPNLVSCVTVNGETPLHVLAKKPNSFKSGSHLRLHNKIIYDCIYVPELEVDKKLEDAKKSRNKDPNKLKHSDWKRKINNFPGNYDTCVRLCHHINSGLHKLLGAVLGDKGKNDVENPPKNDKKSKEERAKFQQFPPNYETFSRLIRILVITCLVIFGIGYTKIRKIREKKQRYRWATQVMNKMVDVDKLSYRYNNNGQAPTQNVPKSHNVVQLPEAPPSEDEETDVTPSKGAKPILEEKEDRNGSGAKINHSKKAEEFLSAIQEAAKKFNTEKNFALVTYDKDQQNGVKVQETPILIAAKLGIIEIVEKIQENIQVAIYDVDENGKNALLLAIENRQTKVFEYLRKQKLPEFVIHRVDKDGNSACHLAAMFRTNHPWRLPGVAFQMHGEVTWFKYVKNSLPPLRFAHYNNKGETPRDIFRATHEELSKAGTEWLIKTSESCSFVAALIAGVAFATSVSVPGGVDEKTSRPKLLDKPVFNVFSVASLVALCFSLTSLVFFLAIITSRCEVRDFKTSLPRRLLMGLSSLFTSIAAILITFCAAHFFVLKDNQKFAALPIYTATSVPLTIFIFAQLPLYFDLTRAVLAQVPVRSHKVNYQ